MPSATPQQPQLKRRASLRDRLRGTWQRPATQPLEKLAEEDAAAGPRVVYKPKHAAADFSRLPVSPLSPPSRHQRHHSHAMRSLDGDNDNARDASAPRHSHAWSRHGDEEAHPASPRDRERESTRRSSRVSNDNYTLVPDPASYVPADKRPAVPLPSPEIHAETVQEKREDDVDDDPRTEDGNDEEDADLAFPLPPPQPPSDYELFLARAEAQDRRWREQLMPNPSQLVHPTGRVKPDPHRQFATAGAATTTPVAAPTSTLAGRSDRAQSHTSGRSPTDTREQQRRRGTDASRPARRDSRRGSSGSHPNTAGWTPRATTAPITASPTNNPPEKKEKTEKKHPPVSLTRPPARAMTAPSPSTSPSAPSKSQPPAAPSKSQPSAPPPKSQPPKSQPSAATRLLVYKTADGDGDEVGAEHQSQMSSTGAVGTGPPHRQSSLRQRLVEYIRPSRGQKVY